MLTTTLTLLTLLLTLTSGRWTSSPQFEAWLEAHSKGHYSPSERRLRQEIWADNTRYIEEYNRLGTGVTLKMNRFGDVTHEEFKEMSSNRHTEAPGAGTVDFVNLLWEAPASKDWRDAGVVTPVKNQGACGSCYAVSAVEVVESMLAIHSGNLQELSVAQVVDCSVPWGNAGCDGGGTPENVFQYLHDTPGLEPQTDYPAITGTCHANYTLAVAHVDRTVRVRRYSEEQLKEAVGLVGPVSVSIDAGERSFQFYSSGIYSDPMCMTSRIDHAVVVVGYGTLHNQDYWIIRNSWGVGWGMEGYLWLARNKQNMCGVASQAVYPVVSAV